jgi:hypothetical protein
MNPIDPKFNSLTQLNKYSDFFNQAGYILQLLVLSTRIGAIARNLQSD